MGTKQEAHAQSADLIPIKQLQEKLKQDSVGSLPCPWSKAPALGRLPGKNSEASANDPKQNTGHCPACAHNLCQRAEIDPQQQAGSMPANETSMGNHCDQRPWRQPRSMEARLTPMKASSAP